MTEARDLAHLRRAIALADEARGRGDPPFGAVLAGPDGAVLLEASNTGKSQGNPLGHAEHNLLVEACARYDGDFLKGCTLFASVEPCAMCAGALYWAGVGRVVFGIAEADLKARIASGPDNPMLNTPCRDVFASGGREVAVVGPLLPEESAASHAGFWE